MSIPSAAAPRADVNVRFNVAAFIRAAREAAGLSQREAGRVFGGGPTAFYKYETAKAIPSESMANLLRLALRQPELFRSRERGASSPLSTIADIALVRRARPDAALDALVRHVYPDHPDGPRQLPDV